MAVDLSYIEAIDDLRIRLGPGASAADGIEAYLAATTQKATSADARGRGSRHTSRRTPLVPPTSSH